MPSFIVSHPPHARYALVIGPLIFGIRNETNANELSVAQGLLNRHPCKTNLHYCKWWDAVFLPRLGVQVR